MARIRYQLGLSQESVAARLNRLGWEGATRFLVAKIEGGTREVNDIEIVLLARALKTTPRDIFKTSTTVSPVPTNLDS